MASAPDSGYGCRVCNTETAGHACQAPSPIVADAPIPDGGATGPYVVRGSGCECAAQGRSHTSGGGGLALGLAILLARRRGTWKGRDPRGEGDE